MAHVGEELRPGPVRPLQQLHRVLEPRPGDLQLGRALTDAQGEVVAQVSQVVHALIQFDLRRRQGVDLLVQQPVGLLQLQPRLHRGQQTQADPTPDAVPARTQQPNGPEPLLKAYIHNNFVFRTPFEDHLCCRRPQQHGQPGQHASGRLQELGRGRTARIEAVFAAHAAARSSLVAHPEEAEQETTHQAGQAKVDLKGRDQGARQGAQEAEPRGSPDAETHIEEELRFVGIHGREALLDGAQGGVVDPIAAAIQPALRPAQPRRQLLALAAAGFDIFEEDLQGLTADLLRARSDARWRLRHCLRAHCRLAWAPAGSGSAPGNRAAARAR